MSLAEVFPKLARFTSDILDAGANAYNWEIRSDENFHEIYIRDHLGEGALKAAIRFSNDVIHSPHGNLNCSELAADLAPALIKCIRGEDIPAEPNSYFYEPYEGPGVQYAVKRKALEIGEGKLLFNLSFYDGTDHKEAVRSFVASIPANLFTPGAKATNRHEFSFRRDARPCSIP